ncbi:MAG: universal stress protein [Burkholderiaceae bacterium]|nr:universal stress protein [Burkholderiaceae bacterium]
MKILLAVDGSKFTKKMLAYLSTHDEVFGAGNDYTALTVQTPLPPRARAAVGAEVVNEYYESEAHKVLAPIERYLSRQGRNVKSTWKVGAAGETIAKFADAGKYDLVIMGSHGYGTLGNLVLGSVATQVLARAKAPVLLVR